jgi:glutathione S-transferase
MEAQLGETAYLLGGRPTAVDCVVLGGLRAHTNMDPDPRKVTARYPRVVAWCESGADDWDGTGDLAPFPESTPFARHVLGEMTDTYQPFALTNRDAMAAGARAFHAHIYGEEVSYLCRPYPEQSRQMVLRRIRHGLDDGERQAATAWLEDVALLAAFS